MKVLFYFGVFARRGGIEEFTRDLGLALLADGVEVEIVCASLKHALLDELASAGAQVTRIPFYWGCRWKLPDLVLFPFARFRVGKSDLVIHRKPFPDWFYRLLSRKPQHVYITAYRPKEQYPEPAARRAFFSRFDAVVTQTDVFKRDLEDCGLEHPIHVIPHIPPAVYDTESRPSCGVLRIGILGRLEDQKNHVYALEIVRALSEELPGGCEAVELHIFGSGALEELLREKADQESFETQFHGRYARKDLAGLIGRCDLFLIPSLSEGQCIVALEILAGGRPLFATPVGALPQILCEETCGALIPLGDGPVAARCISEWLSRHPGDNRSRIQENYLLRFDRKKIKQSYVELIKQLAE